MTKEKITVDVHLGITTPGPQEFSSVRADFTIHGVPIDLDDEELEDTLAKATKTGDAVAVHVEAGVAQEISNSTGLTVEGAGVGQEFKEFKEKFSPAWKTLIDRVKTIESALNTEPEEKPKKRGRPKKK